jgi:hypothetical protein
MHDGRAVELEPYGSGSLVHDGEGELQDSLQMTFLDYRALGVDFVGDILRVECEMNGEPFPLGRFCVTTERPGSTGGVRVVEVEAYSLLWILTQCKIESIRTWTAGTRYTEVIAGLLSEAGFEAYEIEESSAVLATDRADWDIGSEFIEIINDLLAEINYTRLWADYTGVIRAEKYRPPTLSGVTHSYTEGRDSVIRADYDSELDRFGVANVFIVICDSPELETPLRAEAVNSDPNSPYSTVSLGRRVPHIERVDNTPNLSALQDTADRLRSESLETTERIEIVTAPQPDHRANETLLVEVGELAGVYRETGFEFELSPGGQMKHKAVRVIV